MVVDVLVFVPDKSSAVGTIDESKWLGLVVHQTTLLAGFFAPKQRSGGEDNCDIMNVLASSGQVWASFLNKQEHGLRAVVRARPSLYAATRNRFDLCHHGFASVRIRNLVFISPYRLRPIYGRLGLGGEKLG